MNGGSTDFTIVRAAQNGSWTVGNIEVDGLSYPLPHVELGPAHRLQPGRYSWKRVRPQVFDNDVLEISPADGQEMPKNPVFIQPAIGSMTLLRGCISPGMNYLDLDEGNKKVSLIASEIAMSDLLAHIGKKGHMCIEERYFHPSP